MRRADFLMIPLLLVLGLAVAVEWRVHRALFVARHGGPVRVCAFLAGAVGVLLAILLLAVAGVGGLFLVE